MTQQSGRIWVMGGRPLNGAAAIPAAKNSVLPLLAAALLCRGPVRLRAVPRLSDVECSLGLLRGAGCAAYWQGADIVVAGMPSNSTLPGETAAQMRASILFCAPLLARLGRAETSLPGGCNIGARPIDLHLEGLARMGAKELDAGAGKLVLAAPGGLHGADITLRFPSVGATETLLLAAVCARGTTVLRGAAREPEISDLAEFLNRCGGRIEGAGTSTLRIEGRRGLSGCDFSPLPDRIFASTLACAAAAAGGRVELTGCPPALYAPVLEILEQMGCTVERGADRAEVARFGRLYGAGRVFTGGVPGSRHRRCAPAGRRHALRRGREQHRGRHLRAAVRLRGGLRAAGRAGKTVGPGALRRPAAGKRPPRSRPHCARPAGRRGTGGGGFVGTGKELCGRDSSYRPRLCRSVGSSGLFRGTNWQRNAAP